MIFNGPAGRVASVLAVSIEVTIEEASVAAAQMERTMPDEFKAFEDELAADRAAMDSDDSRRNRAKRDPVVAKAAEYAQSCWPAIQFLRPMLKSKGEIDAADAIDRLEEMCATIASKIFRAMSGLFHLGVDPEEVQSDANGSAKVALILIDESRQAWRVLMEPGKAVADGLPARFVGMLDAIEQGVLQRFPRALEFIRPGFDTSATKPN